MGVVNGAGRQGVELSALIIIIIINPIKININTGKQQDNTH